MERAPAAAAATDLTSHTPRARRAGHARRTAAASLAITAVLVCGALALAGATAAAPQPKSEPAAAATAPAATTAAVGEATPPAGAASFVVRGALVFDGTRSLGVADVLVAGGKIAAVGRSLTAPPGTPEVPGAGRTLLPGLIDSHTHAWSEDALRQALMLGVTTELDMGTVARWAAQVKAAQAAGGDMDLADLRSAGTMATVPGGHGTEYGFENPTLTRPDQAPAWVDARLAEGSDYIKIIIEDGAITGRPLPTLDAATVAALVAAAHQRGKLAVAHVTTLAAARQAIAAGADGLAHLFVDAPPDPGFGRFVAAHHAFVVPTLSVLAGITGAGQPWAADTGAGLAHDPRLAPYLSPDAIANLQGAFAHPAVAGVSVANAAAAIRQLLAAGVPILAGTDAPNPGTTHGASTLGEIALLETAGLTPQQALAAATSAPAAAFHLADRGRIAPGLRADLLLVDGDAIADPRRARAIVQVWKQGVAADRAAFRAGVAAATAIQAAMGPGWGVSTDQIAGGSSTATLAVVAEAPPDAPQGTQSLAIRGTVAAGAFSWAGAALSPGAGTHAAVDLSARTGIHFWARGDGHTFSLMVFAKSRGRLPLLQTFTAGPQWQAFDLPWARFNSYDGHDVLLVVFAAVQPLGPFSLQLARVRLE